MYKFDSFLQPYDTEKLLYVICNWGNEEMVVREERISKFSKCLPFQNRVKKVYILSKGIHNYLYT